MAFVFSREGPIEEFGAAEELAEAPEAIETPVVLWHVARYTGAEDFVGAAEDVNGGAEDFEGAVRAIYREGLEESGLDSIAEELGREGIEGEALDLCACFLCIAFFG